MTLFVFYSSCSLTSLRLQPFSSEASAHAAGVQQPSGSCSVCPTRREEGGTDDQQAISAILSSLVDAVMDRVMEKEGEDLQGSQEQDAGAVAGQGGSSPGCCEYCTVKAEDVNFVDMFG